MHPKHRECLVLREYLDLSYDEIAARLTTTRAAVKSLLFRAREEFRQLYLKSDRQPGRARPEAAEGAGSRALGGKRPPAWRRPESHDGGRLLARRRALGMSQKVLAARLGSTHHRLAQLEQRNLADDWYRARAWQEVERYAAEQGGTTADDDQEAA